MTLEQLRIFIGVAEREHVTSAARFLNITQSTASAAITALERQHDVKLFDRVGRGISLTEAGHALLEEARAIVAHAQSASQMLDEFGTLRRGKIRLVASQTIAAYWLPPILASFHQRYPQLSIELAIGNTDQAAKQVMEGEADLGIVEGKTEYPILEQWPIGSDHLVLVSSQKPPRKKIDAAWLRQAPWVMREHGSGTRSTFNAQIRKLGVKSDTLDIRLTLPSNESVRTAVEAGVGITALSSLVVAPAIAAGRLHVLPFDLGQRPFFGLRHKERYRTKATDALLEAISNRS